MINLPTITIPGSVRSKKNSKKLGWIGGKNVPRRPALFPSKAYAAWEKLARQSAWAQIKSAMGNGYPKLPLERGFLLRVDALMYCKGALPDLSGALESIGDAMEGILWVNDKQIVSWGDSRVYRDAKCPRAEITITIMEG